MIKGKILRLRFTIFSRTKKHTTGYFD